MSSQRTCLVILDSSPLESELMLITSSPRLRLGFTAGVGVANSCLFALRLNVAEGSSLEASPKVRSSSDKGKRAPMMRPSRFFEAIAECDGLDNM